MRRFVSKCTTEAKTGLSRIELPVPPRFRLSTHPMSGLFQSSACGHTYIPLFFATSQCSLAVAHSKGKLWLLQKSQTPKNMALAQSYPLEFQKLASHFGFQRASPSKKTKLPVQRIELNCTVRHHHCSVVSQSQ